MNKKKLTRLIAVCTACLGMGVFALSGCKNDDPKTDPDTEATTPETPNTPGDGSGTTTPTTPGDGSSTTTPTTPGDGSGTNTPTTPGDGGGTNTPTMPGDGGGTTTPGNPSEGEDGEKDPPKGDGDESGATTPGTGSDTSKPGEPIVTPPEAEIKPVAGGPTITKASAGELETAYVEWTAAENAKWYNVYVKAHDAADTAYAKLDGPLVREYKKDNKTYYRADALGLKAGQYDMKVVPVSSDDTESTEHAAPATNITVYSHDRSGYAFVNGTSSGAYNEDGTLKSNANVIYITEQTKNTVQLNSYTGFQPILAAHKKDISTPLCVRIIGNITDPSSLEKGDVLIDGIKGGVTMEGVGNDATCNGWGLRIKSSSNVEVRNLGFMNCDSSEGDNVGLQQDNDHIWVHNCDMFYGDAGSDADQVKGDGALDTKKSNYVTHSYNHFWDSGKCNLQGMKDPEEKNGHVTYHHNWYDHSDSRHPRIRSATVHVYNNYFDGNAKYGVGMTYGGHAFVENNYFRSTAIMKPMLISLQGTDAQGEGTFSGENGGIIKAFNNKFDCASGKLKLIERTKDSPASMEHFDCYTVSSRDEQVPNSVKALGGGSTYSNFDTASDFYNYYVDTPEQAKEKIERYAGRMDGGDLTWTFNNETEDSNYAVIPELKAAVVGYKSSVVKIGAVAVSGGGSTGGSTGGEGGNEGGDDTPVTPPAVVDEANLVNSLTQADKNKNFLDDGQKITATIDNTSSKLTLSNAVTVDGHTFGNAYIANSNGAKIFKITAKEAVTVTIYYCTTKDGAIHTAKPTITGGTEQTTSVDNVYKVVKTLNAGEDIQITGVSSCRVSLLAIYVG